MFSHHRWLAWHWKELGIGWVLICWKSTDLETWMSQEAREPILMWEDVEVGENIWTQQDLLNQIRAGGNFLPLSGALSNKLGHRKIVQQLLKDICSFYAGIVFSCPVVCCTSPPPNCLTSVWELSANCGNYFSFGKKLEIYRKKICASLMLIFASLTSNQRSRDQKQSCIFFWLLKWSALVIILIIIVLNEETG